MTPFFPDPVGSVLRAVKADPNIDPAFQRDLPTSCAPSSAPPKIVTEFVYPPIQTRQFDWQAYYDGDEPDDDGRMAHGSGATEQEAIDDLIENHPREAT